MAKTYKSEALRVAHESAKDLHRHGFLDMHQLREFDALCFDPPPPLSPAQIQSLRRERRLSQAVLAAALNVSLSTVRQWEIGAKRPSGSNLRLLDILRRKGLEGVLS